MINRSEMFAPLLEAEPAFGARWQEFLADYGDESELPLYIALGELAEHLIERLKRGETQNFGEVFEVVEHWHAEGDAYVIEAASIGLLESLQNRLGWQEREGGGNIRASDFEPYLGLETRRWWEKLNRFWKGDTAALTLDP